MVKEIIAEQLHFYLLTEDLSAAHSLLLPKINKCFSVINTYDGSKPADFLLDMIKKAGITYRLVGGRLILAPEEIGKYFRILENRSVGNSYFFFDQQPIAEQIAELPDGFFFLNENEFQKSTELNNFAKFLGDINSRGYLCDDYQTFVAWRGDLDL